MVFLTFLFEWIAVKIAWELLQPERGGLIFFIVIVLFSYIICAKAKDRTRIHRTGI